jgi:PST family polysaccharide transporter
LVNSSFRVARVAFVQGLQYLVPLALLPLLARSLGVEEFGALFWFVSAFSLVNAASSFGLEWSGTRSLRADGGSARTVSSLMRLRTLATGVGLAVVWLGIWVGFSSGPSWDELAIMLLLSADSLAAARFPNYAFFAADRAAQAARIQLEGRLVMALWVVGALAVGAFGLLTYPAGMALGSLWVALRARRWLRVQPGWTSATAPWSEVWARAREGAPFFGITLLSLGYTTANMLVVEALSSPTELAWFAASSKLVVALNSIFIGAVGAVLFRDRLAAGVGAERNGVHRSALASVAGLGLAMGLPLWLGADWVIQTYYGPSFGDAAASLRVLAWIPLVVGLSNVLGIQGLAALHRERWLYVPVVVGLVLSLGLNRAWTPSWGALGASGAWLAAELAILALSALLYRRFSRS